MKHLGATMVFLAELGMLTGLGRWAWVLSPGVVGGVAGVVACLLVASVWGLVLSPRARWPIQSYPLAITARLALLLTGAAAAWFSGVEWLGGSTALLATVGTALAGRLAMQRP